MSGVERQRRWRLVLGAEGGSGGVGLAAEDVAIDQALDAVYEGPRKGGLESSSPRIARWLGDIRSYFPAPVVQILQKDALERLDLKRMLLEPELLQAVEPDVHLVADLIALNRVIPDRTRETARLVVARVVAELERRLANPLRQAIKGSLNRAQRNNRPRHADIDWPRTIRANLKHYQPDYGTIIPDRRIGFGRHAAALKDVVICVDQSGSMAGSVVYSSVLAAVMASIRALRTSLVFFDTSVVDMTAELKDPVEILFGTNLGGGTDIQRALAYSQGLIARPSETILILISDLLEGGPKDDLYRRAASIVASGARFITLLALDDRGAPTYDHAVAATFDALGIPCVACTPDVFPDLMATAISKGDIRGWAAAHDIVLKHG